MLYIQNIYNKQLFCYFQNKNPKYLFLYKTIIFLFELDIHSLCHRHGILKQIH